MEIGVTNYSSKKYAFINLISAIIWATITLAYFFGEELLSLLNLLKEYKYFTLLIIFSIIYIIYIKTIKE